MRHCANLHSSRKKWGCTIVRDLLMRLAFGDLVRAKWTNAIHGEWMRNLQKNRPELAWEKLERTKTLMDAHVGDALVEGYEDLIPKVVLPDPDDRHVLAAAIHCKATVIVTFNLKDFPKPVLAEYGIEPQHPDDFACGLLEVSRDTVVSAVREQRGDLKHPPKTARQMLSDFEKLELKRFARALEPFVAGL